MPLDASRWKRYVAFASIAIAVGLAGAGTWGFLISMRPCRLNLAPGTVVDYRLSTTYAELREGTPLPAHERSSNITLVCIGQGNEVALVEPGGEAGRDGISLLSFQSDGTARLINDGVLSDVGKALGFFDFNLLPLPAGLEQSWKVSLVYAALPPGQRQVLGQVRRTANAARPEFELRLPTVEWVNEHQRYVQVRGLVCTYRFDPARGVVDQARVSCETGLEQAEGERRYRISVTLDLLNIQTGVGDTAALRDLALASAETQSALAKSRLERLAPLVHRLEQGGIAAPALREVADRLRLQAGARLQGPQDPQRAQAQTQRQQAPPQAQIQGGWRLQIASIAPSRRSAGEALVGKLRAAGVPAVLEPSGTWLVVRVGPYPDRVPGMAEHVEALIRTKPVWKRVAP